MAWLSILAKVSVNDLQDYQGGDNPILLVLFIIGVIALAVGSVAWILYLKWREAQVWKLCQERDLSYEEYGFLRSFAKRFHETDFTTLITKRAAFDKFLNRVAHHYENVKMTIEDLDKETVLLQTVRGKLNFQNSYQEPRLTSSRALPLNHPVTVTFFDKGTKRTFTFHSKISANNEFFLGLMPPETEIGKETFESKKLALTIALTRENDAEYFYESTLVRVVSYPNPVWYIRHSDVLNRGTEHRTLDLPATITIANEQDAESAVDHEIIIVHLNKEGARFRFKDPTVEARTPSSGLLSLRSSEDSQLLRTHITERIRHDEHIFFRVQFKNLSHEQSMWLNRFAHNVRETPNAAAPLEAPTTAQQKEERTAATRNGEK